MNILFLHQNFPGQFKHLASQLAANPANRIIALCQEQAPRHPRVETHIVYQPARNAHGHHYLRTLEEGVLNGQAVARALLKLKQQGFIPDIVIAHPGWGEALYVKDVFPDAPLLSHFEFFYHADGADANFDPEFPLSLDSRLRIRTRNALHLLNLKTCDAGISPTRWQKSLHPVEYHRKLAVIHEGIDTQFVAPKPEQTFALPNGTVFTQQDEIVTYVARNLEPYRGFHQFMRAVPQLCARRPKAHIVIVGGDDVSYGAKAPDGKTWREHMLDEVSVDATRVHFLGRLPYAQYLRLLQVSSAHVYLTVPFVLSWSMLEAMSAGCLVVGSKTAPVQEVIEHGKNGLLVDFFSPDQIAEAVDQVLDHPDRMQAMREAARKTIIERYEVRQSLRAYGNLIGALLTARKMAGRTNVAGLRGGAA
jgi:glycosyltransferase involved in cell wall biosynthesis